RPALRARRSASRARHTEGMGGPGLRGDDDARRNARRGDSLDPSRAGSRPAVTDDLDGLYSQRFGDAERAGKERVWKPVVAYLRRYFADGPVVDIGSDVGYFIRFVDRHERWATDLRDVAAELPSDVRFVKADGLSLADVLPVDYFGGAFMSHYVGH